MELMPWYNKVFEVEIPIWAKIAGEKYWMADTPVLGALVSYHQYILHKLTSVRRPDMRRR
jgi:hypothetical protein